VCREVEKKAPAKRGLFASFSRPKRVPGARNQRSEERSQNDAERRAGGGRGWVGERSRHGERSARRRPRCKAFDPPILVPLCAVRFLDEIVR